MNQSSFHQTPQERLGRADRVLAEILPAEADHQRTHIRLIPSENYLHPDVAFTLTSSFGNKYSEGYPHKWRSGELILEDARYYQGQVHTNRLARSQNQGRGSRPHALDDRHELGCAVKCN